MKFATCQVFPDTVTYTNCRDDVEIDERIFEPLYQGAHIHVCGAYCAVMELKRVCRLPFSAIAMLLQTLQLLCPPGNKLPQSVYISKFFQKYSSESTKLCFCGSCNQQLQEKQASAALHNARLSQVLSSANLTKLSKGSLLVSVM